MVKVNSKPTVTVYDSDKKIKYIFSSVFDINYPSGQNLLSYSYQRSINNWSSNWNMSFKDNGFPDSKENYLFDLLGPLDVIEIKEFDKIVYIGVITDISFSAKANGQKVIHVSGKGIEFLFEYLTLALDVTAMAFVGEAFQVDYKNFETKLTINKNEAPTVKSLFEDLFKCFSSGVVDMSKLANTTILNMIKKWYGDNYLEVDDNLKFQYPIASNLFTNSTINFITYIRNLLPTTVYEMFSIIKDGSPKILIRKKPFNNDKWNELNYYSINPIALTDYLLTKSINEVYTAFYSYVEGSVKSSDWYQKLGATKEGNKSLINEEKLSIYGYKPLVGNFIGYNTNVKADEVSSSFENNFEILNKELRTWYENLDEMYNLTLTVLNVDGEAIIGNKLKFLKGEFYLTGIDHQWQYGDSVRLTYHCERGGNYESGSFSKLKNVSEKLLEVRGYKL